MTDLTERLKRLFCRHDWIEMDLQSPSTCIDRREFGEMHTPVFGQLCSKCGKTRWEMRGYRATAQNPCGGHE